MPAPIDRNIRLFSKGRYRWISHFPPTPLYSLCLVIAGVIIEFSFTGDENVGNLIFRIIAFLSNIVLIKNLNSKIYNVVI